MSLPPSIERQAWACPDAKVKLWPPRTRTGLSLPPSCQTLFMFVCSVRFPLPASTGIASAARPLWRVQQHTQVSCSSRTMWMRCYCCTPPLSIIITLYIGHQYTLAKYMLPQNLNTFMQEHFFFFFLPQRCMRKERAAATEGNNAQAGVKWRTQECKLRICLVTDSSI